MPELMGLSLLVGLLALMATAAVARGWLRAEEEKASEPVRKYTGPDGGDSVGTLLPTASWSWSWETYGPQFPRLCGPRAARSGMAAPRAGLFWTLDAARLGRR